MVALLGVPYPWELQVRPVSSHNLTFTHLKTGLIEEDSKGWGALPNFKENLYLPGKLGRTALDSCGADAHSADIACAHTGRQVWLALPWNLVKSKKRVLFKHKTMLGKTCLQSLGSMEKEK